MWELTSFIQQIFLGCLCSEYGPCSLEAPSIGRGEEMQVHPEVSHGLCHLDAAGPPELLPPSAEPPAPAVRMDTVSARVNLSAAAVKGCRPCAPCRLSCPPSPQMHLAQPSLVLTVSLLGALVSHTFSLSFSFSLFPFLSYLLFVFVFLFPS